MGANAAAVLLGATLIALCYILPLFGVYGDALALARSIMTAITLGSVPMVWLNVLC
ncbi:hypothetical protein [Mycobacterium uberis]|uniref:hypothetical protein n=1 Tax=Mycobacterium uberis TaxID=2162698 RepID=UPI001401C0CC|nr:hypothetical protein [Mycobacterium uberis]